MIILLEPEHTIQRGDEFYHPYLCIWEPVLDEWIGSNPLPEPFGLPIRRKEYNEAGVISKERWDKI